MLSRPPPSARQKSLLWIRFSSSAAGFAFPFSFISAKSEVTEVTGWSVIFSRAPFVVFVVRENADAKKIPLAPQIWEVLANKNLWRERTPAENQRPRFSKNAR